MSWWATEDVEGVQEEEGNPDYPPPPEPGEEEGALVELRPPGFKVVWDSMD